GKPAQARRRAGGEIRPRPRRAGAENRPRQPQGIEDRRPAGRLTGRAGEEARGGNVIRLLIAALLATTPRYLGPPVKADAGVPDGGDSHGQLDPPVLNPGDEAPMFSGVLHNPESAGMQRVDLSSMVGSDAGADQAAKAVRIAFFGTWCKPCKMEMPFLQQLSTQYKDKGLRVLSVAIDRDEAQWPKITALVAQNHVTYPVREGAPVIAL